MNHTPIIAKCPRRHRQSIRAVGLATVHAAELGR